MLRLRRLNTEQHITTEAETRLASESEQLWEYLYQECPEIKEVNTQISSSGEMRES